MKEESWREYVTLSLLRGGASGGSKPRYSLSEITGVTNTYRANPGAADGIGQFVFAQWRAGQSVNMGRCVLGCDLTPWGLCCYMPCDVNSACSQSNCLACGFSMGTSASVYVALGSFSGCGATIFRRIA